MVSNQWVIVFRIRCEILFMNNVSKGRWKFHDLQWTFISRCNESFNDFATVPSPRLVFVGKFRRFVLYLLSRIVITYCLTRTKLSFSAQSNHVLQNCDSTQYQFDFSRTQNQVTMFVVSTSKINQFFLTVRFKLYCLSLISTLATAHTLIHSEKIKQFVFSFLI